MLHREAPLPPPCAALFCQMELITEPRPLAVRNVVLLDPQGFVS